MYVNLVQSYQELSEYLGLHQCKRLQLTLDELSQNKFYSVLLSPMAAYKIKRSTRTTSLTIQTIGGVSVAKYYKGFFPLRDRQRTNRGGPRRVWRAWSQIMDGPRSFYSVPNSRSVPILPRPRVTLHRPIFTSISWTDHHQISGLVDVLWNRHILWKLIYPQPYINTMARSNYTNRRGRIYCLMDPFTCCNHTTSINIKMDYPFLNASTERVLPSC